MRCWCSGFRALWLLRRGLRFDPGQPVANVFGQRRSRPAEQPTGEAVGPAHLFFLHGESLHPGGEPAGHVRVAAGEVGEEGNECFVVGAFVRGESRAIELLPVRVLHIIDQENAVECKLRQVVRLFARRDQGLPLRSG